MKRIKRKFNCPQCGKLLTKKKGKYGEFYGCSGFPNCGFTASNIDDYLDETKIIKKEYNIDVSPKLARFLLKNSRQGIVYFIKIIPTGLVKIGKASNYISRLKSLNNELGGIIPILLLKTRFYSALEVFLHDLFDKFRRDKDEYFDIPSEYLIEIPKLKIFLGEKVEILEKEKIVIGKLLNEFNKEIKEQIINEAKKEFIDNKIKEIYAKQ